MNPKPAKILIIKLSAIGDVVHTLPCLNALRAEFPKAEIGWVAQQPAVQLLENHPQIDQLFIFPRHIWKQSKPKFLLAAGPFIREIRKHKFDTAIDFQGLTKSGMIAQLCGASRRIGFGDANGKRELNGLFTNIKVTPPEQRPHIIQRNLALLEPLGIRNPGYECVLPVDAAADAYIGQFLAEHRLGPERQLVALNSGAGWITKQWQLENFAQLGARITKELRRQVLLMWGPGEREMAETIEKQMRQKGAEPLLAPPTSIKQLVALVNRCALFVAGDTGPLHIAAALGVPCAGIFGASDGRRNHPLVEPNITLQNWGVPCVPCWKTKCAHRPIHECLRTISVDQVFAAVQTLLNKSGAK